MTSSTADHVLWSQLRSSATTSTWGSRISFDEYSSATPLQSALDAAQLLVATTSAAAPQPLIVVLGRSRRLAVESHAVELRGLTARLRESGTGELRKTVGDVASAFVLASPWPMLVIQGGLGSGSADV